MEFTDIIVQAGSHDLGRHHISGIAFVLVVFCLSPTAPIGAQDRFDFLESLEEPWLSTAESHHEPEEEEPLETDRDSFTPSTRIVDLNRTIFETSYSFIENREAANSHSFPEIITRYGLTERVEIRMGWNYETGGGGEVSGGDAGAELDGHGSIQESQILYGLKAQLTDQEDWIPQSAVILQATTPTSGPETATDFQLGYVYGWRLFDDWQFDSAIRYGTTTEEGDHFNQWAPSVVVKIPLGDHWNIHGEYFGILTEGKSHERSPQYLSPGIHYLFGSNLEIGIRMGWGLNHDAARFFSNVGLGLRF